MYHVLVRLGQRGLVDALHEGGVRGVGQLEDIRRVRTPAVRQGGVGLGNAMLSSGNEPWLCVVGGIANVDYSGGHFGSSCK